MKPEEKKEKIAFHIEKILEILGLDTTKSTLKDTPNRVAKMYVDEVFSGLDSHNYPKITFHEEAINNELVLVKNISLVSFCEHHLVPMVGMAHIAYLPRGRVLGLSKIHRILRHFAKRPQLQERLTLQIADDLQQVLQTEDLAVVIQMKHFCVMARGVEDTCSDTETHVLRGRFETEEALRYEFFVRIKPTNNDYE